MGHFPKTPVWCRLRRLLGVMTRLFSGRSSHSYCLTIFHRTASRSIMRPKTGLALVEFALDVSRDVLGSQSHKSTAHQKAEPCSYLYRIRLKAILPSSFSLRPPLLSCSTDLGFGGSTQLPLYFARLCDLSRFESLCRFSSFDLGPSRFLSSNNSSSSSITHSLFLSRFGSFEG